MMKFEIGTQEPKKWKGEKIMIFNNGEWKYKKQSKNTKNTFLFTKQCTIALARRSSEIFRRPAFIRQAVRCEPYARPVLKPTIQAWLPAC